MHVEFDLLRETPRASMRLYLSAGACGRYALLGQLDKDWHTLGRDYDRTDYGWSWGIGMEFSNIIFLEWNSFRSLHPLPLNNTASPTHRHNGAFSIGINF